MNRLPRDISVHLFGRTNGWPRFLMLWRCRSRGGFRQGQAERWEKVYGPGVEHISAVAFAAEHTEGDPTLDPSEHDAFAWCSYDEAHALLDWPIEKDALAGRREALGVLNAQLRA